jgi:hypothetical protein
MPSTGGDPENHHHMSDHSTPRCPSAEQVARLINFCRTPYLNAVTDADEAIKADALAHYILQGGQLYRKPGPDDPVRLQRVVSADQVDAIIATVHERLQHATLAETAHEVTRLYYAITYDDVDAVLRRCRVCHPPHLRGAVSAGGREVIVISSDDETDTAADPSVAAQDSAEMPSVLAEAVELRSKQIHSLILP